MKSEKYSAQSACHSCIFNRAIACCKIKPGLFGGMQFHISCLLEAKKGRRQTCVLLDKLLHIPTCRKGPHTTTHKNYLQYNISHFTLLTSITLFTTIYKEKKINSYSTTSEPKTIVIMSRKKQTMRQNEQMNLDRTN